MDRYVQSQDEHRHVAPGKSVSACRRSAGLRAGRVAADARVSSGGTLAVADDAGGAPAKDTGGDEVQDVFGSADDDRVASVGAALGSHDDVSLLGQEIDDLALTLVAPLDAYNNLYILHL